MPKTKDPEMEQFEKDLLQSIDEMKHGSHAAVHTPAQIEARKRGRPAGSVKETPKVATTIRFDADLLEALKAGGRGWQTRVNDAMRTVVMQSTANKVLAPSRAPSNSASGPGVASSAPSNRRRA